MLFIIQFVDMVYHNVLFVDIEKFLHHLDESHLIMLCGPSNVLLDLVCSCFVENFVPMFIIHIAL